MDKVKDKGGSMKLHNKYVSATFSEKAAEVTSFVANDSSVEYVWTGDEKYWANRNPILFPVVSTSWGNEYEVDGKKYTLGKHGFARYALFTCTKQTDEEIALMLTDDDDTLAQYPYHFKLIVTYRLEDKKLWLNYEVINTDDRPIPFQIGFHPAFNCPLNNDESFDEYRFSTEKKENAVSTSGYMLEKEISLKGNEFFNEKSAVFFNGLTSSYVDLTNGKHTIRVGIKNFNRVGFWHKSPDTPFVCIEPQHGHGFAKDNNDDVPNDNTIILPIGQTYRTSYYWEII